SPLERQAGGSLVFPSHRDSAIFGEAVILAGFLAVWPRFCPVQTRVSSEIFLVISGSRVQREEIWDSGEQEPDPTILRRPQQGCRIAEERIVCEGLGRFFRAACSFFLCCRPLISLCAMR